MSNSSPYSLYKKRTCGNVLHFIYYYCGLRMAERVIVGEDKLYRNSEETELLATFHFNEDNYPVFKFTGYNAEYFENNQKEKYALAINAMR